MGVASVVRTAEGADDSCEHVYDTMLTVCCMGVASVVRTAEGSDDSCGHVYGTINMYGRGISSEDS